MKVAGKVAWSEGLLLLPQHFQQADKYHESLIAARFAAGDPQGFGVVDLQLDGHRLAQQQEVALLQFEGVMPDGLPLAFGEGGWDLPPARAVADHFTPTMEALEVYLSVPAERPGISNYAGNGERLRYRVQSRKIADISTDDRAVDLGLLQLNPRLLFGDEPRDDGACIKIAEIVRTGPERLAVSTTYIPPCLQVRSSPVLTRRMKALLSQMVVRLRSLSAERKVVAGSRVEFNASDITRFLRLNAFNSSLPMIRYLAELGDVPPRTAYWALTQFAGQLAAFSPEADMAASLPYEFLDLRRSFDAVFSLLEHLISATDVETHITCPLELHDQSRFFGDLTDPRLANCRRFFLAVESSTPRARLVQEIVQNAKITSLDDLEIVLASNVGGVDVRENQQPPPQLPQRQGLVYFDMPIRHDDVYWRHVAQDRNVVVWLPPSLDSGATKIKLVGLLDSR